RIPARIDGSRVSSRIAVPRVSVVRLAVAGLEAGPERSAIQIDVAVAATEAEIRIAVLVVVRAPLEVASVSAVPAAGISISLRGARRCGDRDSDRKQQRRKVPI